MQGPKYKFPSSQSSPQLQLSDDEIQALVEPQLSLSAPETRFMPYFSKQESDGIRIKADYLVIEAMSEWRLQEKHYLTSESRKFYEVTVENGLLQDVYNKLLHGVYLYVIFPNNILYACQVGTQRFHSYLSSGLNVKGAGLLYCEYGRLITVSNESGHYKPTHLEMRPALSMLYTKVLHPFVFEDHSTLDLTKPFQDVKFFAVDSADMQAPLERIETKEDLKEIINAATAQAGLKLRARFESMQPLIPLVDDDDNYSYGNSSGYYIDENEVIASASTCDPVAESSTEDPNTFMRYTCLARLIRQQAQSRFLGHRRATL